MANDQYPSSSLDNEVDLTQQMPSTNPASRNVKDHPIEYFHVNSGARFDKPMRQIMAPASDDGPDFTQPNDAPSFKTRLNRQILHPQMSSHQYLLINPQRLSLTQITLYLILRSKLTRHSL